MNVHVFDAEKAELFGTRLESIFNDTQHVNNSFDSAKFANVNEFIQEKQYKKYMRVDEFKEISMNELEQCIG